MSPDEIHEVVFKGSVEREASYRSRMESYENYQQRIRYNNKSATHFDKPQFDRMWERLRDIDLKQMPSREKITRQSEDLKVFIKKHQSLLSGLRK